MKIVLSISALIIIVTYFNDFITVLPTRACILNDSFEKLANPRRLYFFFLKQHFFF